jgi:hypothetical protein
MNRYQIHCIVEYIRMQDQAQDRFPFDVHGVEDNLEEVLAYFGFFAQLTEAEKDELKAELSRIAEESEWSEAAYLVEQEVRA